MKNEHLNHTIWTTLHQEKVQMIIVQQRRHVKVALKCIAKYELHCKLKAHQSVDVSGAIEKF